MGYWSDQIRPGEIVHRSDASGSDASRHADVPGQLEYEDSYQG